MKKTLADLKRSLSLGTRITMTACMGRPEGKLVNVPRYVVRVKGNGVELNADKDAVKGSFLELPNASLVDFDGETIRVYEAGHREHGAEYIIDESIRGNCILEYKLK